MLVIANKLQSNSTDLKDEFYEKTPTTYFNYLHPDRFFVFLQKEKNDQDDFPPGRFHFVYVLKNNANYDTITGELTGPYGSAYYTLKVRQELSMDKSLKAFNIGGYKKMMGSRFSAQVNIDGVITYEDHASDYLVVHFESGDTLFGSLTLTRKE